MSDEIKKFREAVEKFDEIQADLEVLKEQLDNSFDNYKSVSDNSSETVAKLNQILQSVNTLQINLQNTIEGVESQSAKILNAAEAKADAATKAANDLKTQMGKYWSREYSQTKKDFEALLANINSSVYDLKRDIAIKIRDAADGLQLDTTELQKAIREQVGKIDIEPIKDAIDRANAANQRLDKSINVISGTEARLRSAVKSLKDKAEEINEATGKFNTVNKSLSITMAAALMVTGMVIGAATMTYFKIDAISDYYFSRYDKKQAELEEKIKYNQEKYKQLDRVSQWLYDLDTETEVGLFTDTKEPYLLIKKGSYGKYWRTKDKDHLIIQLKE